MAFRFSHRLAAAVCLGLSSAAGAADLFAVKPAAVGTHPDQQLADAVASKLAQSGSLNGYRVEITCESGKVELAGAVRDQAQKDEVGKIARSVKGVKKLDNQLEIKGDIQKTQAESLPSPLSNLLPGAMNSGVPGPMIGGGDGPPAPIAGSVPSNATPIPAPPMMQGGPGAPGAYASSDPTPIGMATGGVYDSSPPRMPPYAWPTYAPYNNYSRVGYPTEYPQDAFPFIGPFYPFPKVPLGYRAIKLEWDDGHWYYGRTATKRDYWKVRYW